MAAGNPLDAQGDILRDQGDLQEPMELRYSRIILDVQETTTTKKTLSSFVIGSIEGEILSQVLKYINC